MSTQTAIHTPRAVVMGSVQVGMHGMFGTDPEDVHAELALEFATLVCGLRAGFHGSTADMRRLAAELIRHADVTDAACEAARAAQGPAA